MRLFSVVQRKPPLLLLPTFRLLVEIKNANIFIDSKQGIVQY